MINRLILANLQRRPMRSLISIVAVAMEVVLILLVVGLTNGMVNDHLRRTEGIGADIIVRAGGSSAFAELSPNTLPLQEAEVFAKVPGVAAVAPVAYHVNNSLSAAAGIHLPSFDRVSGGFHFLRGRAFRPGAHEIIVDDVEADAKHYRLGQTTTLMGTEFSVTGVFEHGMGSRVFMDINVLDQLTGTPNKTATFYIRTARGADPHAVVAALQTMAPANNVQLMSDYLSLITVNTINPALPVFQHVMVGIAVAIGFLVIFLSLYTTVLERTREIGILKSLGASRGYIVEVILREAEMLAGAGVGAGAVIAYGLWRTLARVYPTLTIEMTWKWVLFAALVALLSSAVGALYPAYKAAGQDAVAALAYE